MCLPTLFSVFFGKQMTKKINAPFLIKKLIALTIPTSVVPMFFSILYSQALAQPIYIQNHVSNGFHVAFSASFESPLTTYKAQRTVRSCVYMT